MTHPQANLLSVRTLASSRRTMPAAFPSERAIHDYYTTDNMRISTTIRYISFLHIRSSHPLPLFSPHPSTFPKKQKRRPENTFLLEKERRKQRSVWKTHNPLKNHANHSWCGKEESEKRNGKGRVGTLPMKGRADLPLTPSGIR